MGSVICFVVAMSLFLYFMYDGTLLRRKPVQLATKDETAPTKEESVLTLYLREHVYKQLTFSFQHIEGSTNGYYYEKGLFSLTVFDYPTYRTAQLFQVKPYQQIAVMRSEKQSFRAMEIDDQFAPEENRTLIHLLFEKVQTMNLQNVHNTTVDDAIKDTHERIQTLLHTMKEQKDLLPPALVQEIKQVERFDLPALMQHYQHLPTYDLQTGKERIKEELTHIEKTMTYRWQHVLQQNRQTYERIIALSK